MNGAMVRALLDGSKTQTRRIVKKVGLAAPAPQSVIDGAATYAGGMVAHCPYGQPGDRIWVRETWGVISHAWDEACNLIDWAPDRPATAISEMPFGQGYYSGHVIYAADGSFEWSGDDDGDGDPRSAWHPSIHMPRRASRILLEIVSVRVERLHDISTEDIIAEGLSTTLRGYDAECDLRDQWRKLWESTGGDWDSNPWLWVINFAKVKA